MLTISVADRPKSFAIKAISCDGKRRSAITIDNYELEPGPTLVVALKMEGDVSASDIKGAAKDRFISSFATAMGLQKERVFIVSLADARRRLLAVNIELGIAAKSDEDADTLKTSVENADLSAVAAGAGLSDTKIAGVETSVLQPDDAMRDLDEGSSQVGVYVGVVVTLAVVIAGMACCYWFWHHPSMQKDKHNEGASHASADVGFVMDSEERQASIRMLADEIEMECYRGDLVLHPYSDQLGDVPTDALSNKMIRAIGWWKYR